MGHSAFLRKWHWRCQW